MTDFPLYITVWTALILGTLMVFLTMRVIFERRSKGIVLGDNDDRIVLKKIRGHANAVEQIPMALIILGFVEYLQGSTYAMIIAALLVIGRLMHAAYFSFHGTHWRYRQIGMSLSVLASILGLLALLHALLS